MRWQGKPLGRGTNLDVHVIDIASAANLSLGLDLARRTRRTGLKCNWTYLSYQETSSHLDLTECWLTDSLTHSHQLCSQTKVAANECSADETQKWREERNAKHWSHSNQSCEIKQRSMNEGSGRGSYTPQSHTLPQTEIHTHIYMRGNQMWRRDLVVNRL